jgi:hypothetical protein
LSGSDVRALPPRRGTVAPGHSSPRP